MTKQSTRIFLIRHGEAESNINSDKGPQFHKQWGDLESPLTEKGKQQAKKRAEELKHIHFDAIFSSDLTRTIQTAEIIASERTVPIQTSKRIRERTAWAHLNMLQHEGRSKESIYEEMINDLEKLNEQEKMNYTYQGKIESALKAAERLYSFLREISQSHAGKTILVVNHSNNMRSLLNLLGHAPFDELPPGAIANTGLIVLETDGDTFKIEETQGVTRHKDTKRTT